MSITSTNKTSKSEHTRTRIRQSYLSLMQEKCWDKITVKDICTTADITRGTFYQYFNDIYDLMEQIQEPLLAELEASYSSFLEVSGSSQKKCPASIDELDCTPPASLIFWFDFCKKNKNSIKVLLSPNGDSYFIAKIKNILSRQVNQMMDDDSMPHDNLRSHFTKAFIELHFMTARTWLDSSEEDFLSTDEILAILNAMRIGANYLSYREKTD